MEKLRVDKSHLKIIHQTSNNNHKRANAAQLMGAQCVVVLRWSGEEAFKPFAEITPEFTPFRDACGGECSYKCTILHCLKGLEYALKLGWFDQPNFNVAEYEKQEKVEQGDLNWIIPGKCIAFSSPNQNAQNGCGLPPEHYVPQFNSNNVTHVVRLNTKTQDRERFLRKGVSHTDLFFPDGSIPPDSIVEKFIAITEQEKGSVAVHCKAGLGRTGCLIGAYAMKHQNFPPREFTGQIRIVRPGSILGPQQHWMINQSRQAFLAGEEFRKRFSQPYPAFWKDSQGVDNDLLDSLSGTIKSPIRIPVERDDEDEFNKMSESEKKIARNGHYKQGEMLYGAKALNERLTPVKDSSPMRDDDCLKETTSAKRKVSGKIGSSLSLGGSYLSPKKNQ